MEKMIHLHKIVNKMLLDKKADNFIKLNKELIELVGHHSSKEKNNYIMDSRIGKKYYHFTKRYILD